MNDLIGSTTTMPMYKNTKTMLESKAQFENLSEKERNEYPDKNYYNLLSSDVMISTLLADDSIKTGSEHGGNLLYNSENKYIGENVNPIFVRRPKTNSVFDNDEEAEDIVMFSRIGNPCIGDTKGKLISIIQVNPDVEVGDRLQDSFTLHVIDTSNSKPINHDYIANLNKKVTTKDMKFNTEDRGNLIYDAAILNDMANIPKGYKKSEERDGYLIWYITEPDSGNIKPAGVTEGKDITSITVTKSSLRNNAQLIWIPRRSIEKRKKTITTGKEFRKFGGSIVRLPKLGLAVSKLAYTSKDNVSVDDVKNTFNDVCERHFGDMRIDEDILKKIHEPMASLDEMFVGLSLGMSVRKEDDSIFYIKSVDEVPVYEHGDYSKKFEERDEKVAKFNTLVSRSFTGKDTDDDSKELTGFDKILFSAIALFSIATALKFSRVVTSTSKKSLSYRPLIMGAGSRSLFSRSMITTNAEIFAMPIIKQVVGSNMPTKSRRKDLPIGNKLFSPSITRTFR